MAISADSSARDAMSRLDLRDLKATLAVAEAGSFRKASQLLDVNQSAISRRVQKLEDFLGVSLFERRPTGAFLTMAGCCFVDQIRTVVDTIGEAILCARSAGAGSDGRLRLGLIASMSCGVLRRLIGTFLKDHPDVELEVVEGARGALLTQMSHRRLDAIFASGTFSEQYGDAIQVVFEPIYLAVPTDHRLLSKPQVSWSDLYSERFVVSAEEPGPEIHEYLIKRLASLGRTPDIERHAVGREGLMNLVGLGVGISLVADHWRGVSYPNVVFVPVENGRERIPFSLLWRADNDNPALRRFVSLARIEAKQNASLS